MSAPSSAPRVLVPLATGFEEIEAITIIDVLRRAGCCVVVASLNAADVEIVATRQTRHMADAALDAVLQEPYDAIVLPGGQPGSNHLAAHEPLRARLQAQAASGGVVAAICAAPLALARAGLLTGKQYTCHPGAAKEVAALAEAESSGARVQQDGTLLTGQAAGSAMEFALELVRILCGADKVAEVNAGLLAKI